MVCSMQAGILTLCWSWQDERASKIYDKVTEEEYRMVVKQRLEEDDFIEDDDGSGYVDNGMDDFDRPPTDEDASSDDGCEHNARSDTSAS